MPFSGQLWYLTEGGGADAKIARVNDDGTTSTTIVNSFATNVSGLGVDTAAGFYFAVVNNSVNDHALLVRGSINSSAAPVVVVDFSDEIVVETIEVDAINHKMLCRPPGRHRGQRHQHRHRGSTAAIRRRAPSPTTAS